MHIMQPPRVSCKYAAVFVTVVVLYPVHTTVTMWPSRLVSIGSVNLVGDILDRINIFADSEV